MSSPRHSMRREQDSVPPELQPAAHIPTSSEFKFEWTVLTEILVISLSGKGNDRGFVAGAGRCRAKGDGTVTKVHQLPDMLRRQRLDLSTIHYQFSIISSVAVLELGLLTASRHLLRDRKLLGGHFGCNFIAPLDRHISCIAVRCCRREGKPRVRAHEILPHACAVGIHYSEIHLRRRVSLHCREAIPFYGFLIIPRYALASLVRQTETELRRCGSLRRREAIPLHGFLIILRHAFPFCVYRTQSHLRP